MRIALVTAGTVGLGHIVPAEAIRRGLTRTGFDGQFRMFGPASEFACASLDYFTQVPIVPAELADPFSAEESALARALADYRPELILAETHWAPLLYILPQPDCQSWLLLRKVPDMWFTGTDDVPFNPESWDRIISFEPPLRHAAFTDRVEPIVICNPDELKPRGSLRQRWSVPDGKRLVVVAQAGERGEAESLEIDDRDAMVVRLDGRSADHPFPLAEWLGDADQIFAGAGYSAYWESKWLGWYDRTRFTAFPRRIDDQAWRLRECADYWPKENGADQLARWIALG